MAIIPFTPDLADLTAASYNRTFADVPFCWPVAPDALADPAALPCDNLAMLHDDLVLVALEDGRVVGYVHAAAEDIKPEDARNWDDYDTPQGVLRMFWYERGHRAAGEALLARAEEHLRVLALPRIEVLHSKRRYLWHHLPHVHLTQRVEQVHGLLLARGYARDKGNVALTWENATEASPAPCDVPHTLRREKDLWPGPIPRVLLFAEQGETFCGICVGASLAEQHADPPESDSALCEPRESRGRQSRPRDWLYIRWLMVAEPFRRRGLAQHLLTAMFQEMGAYGARHAAICCIEQNTPALLLYANSGFKAVDFSYTYVKTLG